MSSLIFILWFRGGMKGVMYCRCGCDWVILGVGILRCLLGIELYLMIFGKLNVVVLFKVLIYNLFIWCLVIVVILEYDVRV